MTTFASNSALLIDHDDSFTQNVRVWLSEKFEVTVVHHKNICNLDLTKKYSLIVLSPGPRSAQDYPHSIKFLRELPPSQSVLGICLGLQFMALACDSTVKTYAPPKHGKTSKLISNIKTMNGLSVGRYHSMYCELNSDFEILATSENLTMMAQHKNKKWLGYQFHPESFLTENSKLFLNYVTTEFNL